MSALVLSRSLLVEAFRSKLFLLATCAVGIALVTAVLIGPIALGTDQKIMRDVGLAAVVICAALMIFTGGIQLVGREIEQKSVTFIVTRPISRASYVLGRFLGMTLTAWGILCITALVFTLVLLLRGDPLDAALAQSVLMSALELIVLSAVAVFFATLASPIPAMLYGMGVFVAGHTVGTVLDLMKLDESGTSSRLFEVFRWVIPDLTRFDMRLHAVHGVTIGSADVAWSAAYALIYSAAVLAIACAAFGRRELS